MSIVASSFGLVSRNRFAACCLGLWWTCCALEEGLRSILTLYRRVATAWAIVKALLPLRIILSVWATPWFARVSVIPLTNFVKRAVGLRTSATAASGAAGTGAVAAGAVGKTTETTSKQMSSSGFPPGKKSP